MFRQSLICCASQACTGSSVPRTFRRSRICQALASSDLGVIVIMYVQIKDEQGNFKTENFSELRHVAFNITDQNGNADGEKPATAAPAR